MLIDEVSAIGFVAAATAGLAGTISLVTSKSAAVVGVAVSITTISAAANVGIVLARGDWQDALGPLGALLFNLSALIGAGLVSFAAVHHVPWLRRRLAG